MGAIEYLDRLQSLVSEKPFLPPSVGTWVFVGSSTKRTGAGPGFGPVKCLPTSCLEAFHYNTVSVRDFSR